jgi:hypothetical protein
VFKIGNSQDAAMRRFSRFFLLVFCVAAILSLTTGRAPAIENSSPFATVAPDDPLQAQLQVVRRAGWSNLGLPAAPAGSTPAALTRYEMALETAKAVIAVRARHNADASWDRAASPQSLRALRALRALCVAFKSELTGFNVDVTATLNLLDEILLAAAKAPPETHRSQAGSTPGAPPTLRLTARRDEAARDETAHDSLMQSLSQKLRIYSALDSLARQQNDPFAFDAPTAFSARESAKENSGGVRRLRAGATFEVNPGLQLRAELQNRNDGDTMRAPGLRDFLNGESSASPLHPFDVNTRSIGAGVDLNLRSGVMVSGDVTRVEEFSGGDAMRYEGGVGFSGWQNRVALSAHLSRLVPEDSLALGVTAARLNLGVGLTTQIQLKLMYQQMFGGNAALQTNPRFGGGLDFSF